MVQQSITRLDMRNILGKRPFDRKDDMDNWLDEHQRGERSAPIAIEQPIVSEPTPESAPGVASSPLDKSL